MCIKKRIGTILISWWFFLFYYLEILSRLSVDIHTHLWWYSDWIKVNRQPNSYFFFAFCALSKLILGSAALCDAYFSPSSPLLMDKIHPIRDVFFTEFPVSLRSMTHYGSRILIAFVFTLTLRVCANQNVSDVYSLSLSEKLLDTSKEKTGDK